MSKQHDDLPPLHLHRRSRYRDVLQEKREKLLHLDKKSQEILAYQPPNQKLTPQGWWPQVLSFAVLYTAFGLSTWLGIHNSRLRPIKWGFKHMPEGEELKPLAPKWLTQRPELPVLGYIGAILLNAVGNIIQSHDNKDVNTQYSEPLQRRMWLGDKGNEAVTIGALGMGWFVARRTKFSSPTWDAVNTWTKRQGDNVVSLTGWIVLRFFNGEIARERNSEARAQWELRDQQLEECRQKASTIINEILEEAGIIGEEHQALQKDHHRLVKALTAKENIVPVPASLSSWDKIVQTAQQSHFAWREYVRNPQELYCARIAKEATKAMGRDAA